MARQIHITQAPVQLVVMIAHGYAMMDIIVMAMFVWFAQMVWNALVAE